mmetsp:Transcript_12516/g.29613  ORF Transcript_12516/g.29613 Transcript_12516/m.29613 type:complete len:97 (+) Transcript_12516:3014-3304(+)
MQLYENRIGRDENGVYVIVGLQLYTSFGLPAPKAFMVADNTDILARRGGACYMKIDLRVWNTGFAMGVSMGSVCLRYFQRRWLQRCINLQTASLLP